MGLSAPPRHLLGGKRRASMSGGSAVLLRKFERDVGRMEQPVEAMEGHLEQQLVLLREQRRRQHEHLAQLSLAHATGHTTSAMALAEQERVEQAEAAAEHSEAEVAAMTRGVAHATTKMKEEVQDMSAKMKGDVQRLMKAAKVQGQGTKAMMERDAIKVTQSREHEMQKVMDEYMARTHKEEDTMMQVGRVCACVCSRACVSRVFNTRV
jgi:hypothetical protein